MSQKLIILVEDDVNLRQSIALILRRAGYLVTSTDCVDIALEVLISRKYHLLISDANLPDTNNILLPKILDSYPLLPIIILTDRSNAEVESESKQSNAHYLIKPIAPERLLDSVGSILGRQANSNHLNQQIQPIDSP